MLIMLSFEATWCIERLLVVSFPDSMTSLYATRHQTVEPRHNKMPSGFLISSEAGQDRHSYVWRFKNQV